MTVDFQSNQLSADEFSNWASRCHFTSDDLCSDLLTRNFAKWLRITRELLAGGRNLTNSEMDSLCDHLETVRDVICAAPARSIRGYLIKIIVADDNGDMNNTASQMALAAEAREALAASFAQPTLSAGLALCPPN